jgi:hypothetical protein
MKECESQQLIEYLDSVSGKPLFRAPIGRTMKEFLKESKAHGWPSFRDSEVVWENVRVLPNGETVSTAGTHLGHVSYIHQRKRLTMKTNSAED